MSGSDDGGFLSRWARRKAQARQGAKEGGKSVNADIDAARCDASIVEGIEAPIVERDGARSVERIGAPLGELNVPPAIDVVAPATLPDTTALPSGAASASVPSSVSVPPHQLPTLEDVAMLTRHSDYSRFVQPGVSSDVRNAALKQLFTDPHFNVMDGLDTYIDDYGKPDPIPLAMLRELNQSRLLGLFDTEDEQDAARARASSGGGAATAVAESMPTDRAPPTSGASPDRSDDDPDLRLQQDDGAERAGPAAGAGA